jgi:TPR repeat protein
MKALLASFSLLFAFCANAQYGPNGKYGTPFVGSQDPAAMQAAQDAARAQQENVREYQYALAETAAQQDELNRIVSKDPWRRINGVTNFCNASGWSEFQGVVQQAFENGVVFKGEWGPITTVNTYAEDDPHLTTTHVSASMNTQNGQTTVTTGPNSTTYNQSSAVNENRNAVTDIGITHPKIYGENIFFVDNFPYPASTQQGYEEMMAYESGYISYTNSVGQIITIHKLDYGTPCTKIWTPEEILAANPRTAAKERALKANQKMADSGDAYGLLRMGERYRDGEDLPKDLDKARDYLTKAAAAGSSTAADELSQLPKNN